MILPPNPIRRLPRSCALLLAGLLGLNGACGEGGPAPAGTAAAPAAAAAAKPAGPPPVPVIPGVGEARIEMLRGKDPQERVVIGDGGLALGPAGGSLSRLLFVSPTRLEDLKHFTQTYAPFEVRGASAAGALHLTFRGRGRAKPGPAERRM
ncbi:MAG TPA: hypothetical protein VHN15_06465, partial [Thermoanaerobaculia bacterium]|nr:hypothetical protein [Thermoanaerobaculia bacterium]